MQTCPCCSGVSYDLCCKPFHDGTPAPSPLALMRSRYCAYALGKAGYIMSTTDPQSVYAENDTKKWEKGIVDFSRSTRFIHLDILGYGEDWVLFRARLIQDHRSFFLKEKSHFRLMDGRWFYFSGEVAIENS